MPSTNYELSPNQLSEFEKMEKPWLTIKELTQNNHENLNKMFESTELTEEEKKSLKEICDDNLKIESNRELQWIKWEYVTLELWNKWKSYKMFFPDGTTEYWLDLLIENNKKEFEEIENYFKENWIDKPLKISLLFLLGNVIRKPFWKKDDSNQSRRFNVYGESSEFKHTDLWEANAQLLLVK